MSEAETAAIFDDYFAIFPWSRLPAGASGFDMGCGSGRWARLAAPRVGHLHCIDPSAAIDVARRRLAGCENVSFHQTTVDGNALPAGSQDFGYSLGVLHHVPDTAAAIRSCVAMLRPGAPFLVYLYYAFDNRSTPFRLLWKCSDVVRRVISQLPSGPKHAVTDVIAVGAYLPLASLARLVEWLGGNPAAVPLSYYRTKSFYTMRTDSRDRFGTPLEQRFTRVQIERMLRDAGLIEIRFSDREPYWCAVGVKA